MDKKNEKTFGKPTKICTDKKSVKEYEEKIRKINECLDLINKTGIEKKFSAYIILNASIELLMVNSFKVPLHYSHFEKLLDLLCKKYKKCWDKEN